MAVVLGLGFEFGVEDEDRDGDGVGEGGGVAEDGGVRGTGGSDGRKESSRILGPEEGERWSPPTKGIVVEVALFRRHDCSCDDGWLGGINSCCC